MQGIELPRESERENDELRYKFKETEGKLQRADG